MPPANTLPATLPKVASSFLICRTGTLLTNQGGTI